jgi:hypothetical protein
LPLAHEYHGLGADKKHGIDTAKGFQSYSNDGDFVWSPGDLDKDGKQDEVATASGFPNHRSLTVTQFVSELSAASASQKTNFPMAVMLWRPAYNLQAETGSKTVDVTSYNANSDPFSRLDKQTAFDALEQAVLRKFLGI